MDGEIVEQDITGFLPIYSLVQISGFSAVLGMGLWTYHFLDGFGWVYDPTYQFNWHPLLMTTGMIFLYGNALLMYRIFRKEIRRKLLLLHAGKVFYRQVSASESSESFFYPMIPTCL